MQGPFRNASDQISHDIVLDDVPIAGNVLILTHLTEYGRITNISQTNVTWTINDVESTTGVWLVEICHGIVAAGAGKTISITTSFVNANANVGDVCEYSGLNTASLKDKTATSAGFNVSNYLTGITVPISQGHELVIGAIGTAYYTQANPINGFTMLDGAPDGTYPNAIAFLEKVVHCITPQNSGTDIGGNIYHYAGAIASYRGTDIGTPALGIFLT